jgi:hypothetical protein
MDYLSFFLFHFINNLLYKIASRNSYKGENNEEIHLNYIISKRLFINNSKNWVLFRLKSAWCRY